MASAADVIAQRAAGADHVDESTVTLVTLDIESSNMPEPLYIVKNSVEQIELDGKTYLPYFFNEEMPPQKSGVRPEMTISFLQVSEEQERALIETANVYPWPTVKRSTWEVTKDGDITRTSEFIFPMPIRRTNLGENGVIDVTCAEEDLDDIPLNPIVYTIDDHEELKAYTG